MSYFSTGMMALASVGSVAPVMTSIANSPFGRMIFCSPAAWVAMILYLHDPSLWLYVLMAMPSIMTRSKGGASRSARMSVAMTLPSAFSSATFSEPIVT